MDSQSIFSGWNRAARAAYDIYGIDLCYRCNRFKFVSLVSYF